MKKSYFKLQPDAFTRFRTVIFLLESMTKNSSKNKTYSILDIGGSSTFIYDFLIESGFAFELTIVDPRPKPAGLNSKITYIQSTGEEARKLNKKFDFTIMIDMLEHVSGDANKRSVIESAIQLTKEAVIIAGPYDDFQTDKFEHSLNSINKELFGVDQDWLLEHFECKKPNLDKIRNYFDKAGWKTNSVATLPFNFWLASAFANLATASSEQIKKATIEAINTEFNTEFEKKPSSFFTDQGYRKIIIASQNKLPEIKIKSISNSSYLDYEMLYSIIIAKLVMTQTKAIYEAKKTLGSLSYEKGLVEQKFETLKEEIERLKDRNNELERHIFNHRAALKKIPLSESTINLVKKIKK
ncbi:MAG: hypothetical protein H6799_02175 [Candidatus Nomurabacteria bacterium]|nr:MAG: hypothetical protein H6799_02175 [Candidatus Nomurabacteria bacterium]HRV76012.1 hypothetical protein [Candidatus Saccharimonadales bacterium]